MLLVSLKKKNMPSDESSLTSGAVSAELLKRFVFKSSLRMCILLAGGRYILFALGRIMIVLICLVMVRGHKIKSILYNHGVGFSFRGQFAL